MRFDVTPVCLIPARLENVLFRVAVPDMPKSTLIGFDIGWCLAVSFGHFEVDECGAMNEWLAVSPLAEVVHGVVCCRVSITTWQTERHAFR